MILITMKMEEQPAFEFCKVEIIDTAEEFEEVPKEQVDVQNSCPYCSRIYKPSHLKLHIQVHTEERPYKCDECQETFEQKEPLEEHKLSVHEPSRNKLFWCRKCNKKYRSPQRYKIHVKLHEAENNACQKCDYIQDLKVETIKCELCNRTFISNAAKSDHKCIDNKAVEVNSKQFESISQLKTSKLFRCKKCNKKFRSAQGYAMHKNLHEDVNYACDKCDYKTCGKGVLRLHQLRTHLKVVANRCELCDTTFPSNAAKRDHNCIHNKAVYACEVCLKQFVSISKLKRHMKNVHNDGKTIKCDLCSFTTTTPLMYISHIRGHKNQGDGGILTCEHCDFSTFTETQLASHLILHNDELLDKCHLCSFKTKSYKGMKSHIKRTHGGVENFKCFDCDVAFFTQIEMELHNIRAHKQLKQCEWCSETFTRVYSYNNHILRICKSKPAKQQEAIAFEKVDIKEEFEDEEVEQKIYIKEEGVNF